MAGIAEERGLPDIDGENLNLFITLWESLPVLWNPRHPHYKNKVEKAKALVFFAESMTAGWTAGLSTFTTTSTRLVFQPFAFFFNLNFSNFIAQCSYG
jgi:hypothetical protein